MNFEQAAEKVKTLKTSPSNEELLELYSLYKQATIGNCNTSQPWAFDVTNRAKWDAWNGKSGMSSATAKANYIKLVQQLLAKY